MGLKARRTTSDERSMVERKGEDERGLGKKERRFFLRPPCFILHRPHSFDRGRFFLFWLTESLEQAKKNDFHETYQAVFTRWNSFLAQLKLTLQ